MELGVKDGSHIVLIHNTNYCLNTSSEKQRKMRQINDFVANLYNMQPKQETNDPVYEENEEKNDWYEASWAQEDSYNYNQNQNNTHFESSRNGYQQLRGARGDYKIRQRAPRESD